MDAPSPADLDPGLAGRLARPFEGIENGYVAGYRVRFDEAGPDGHLRTSGLLRYAQDVAWRHSEALGFDRAWYQDRGLGWVVRGVDLELRAPIPLGTTLRLSTAVIGHRRIWARRFGECRFADGGLAARVTTDWVLLDGRNRVIRIPDDFGVAFANPEVRSEIIRVAVDPHAGGPRDPAAHHDLTVRPSDLDPVDHVNNAVYLDWVEEALDAAGWPHPVSAAGPRSLRLEYLASAGPRDAISIDLFGSPEAWRARIGRADGAELVHASMGPAAA